MLPIKGLQKLSLIDFSPYQSCVVFVGGCNFRCPYCQNPDLVIGFEEKPDIPDNQVFELLKERKKWLDAVVITGGEPTIYPDLVDFVKKIKDMGYMVKLDTNGANPSILYKLMQQNMIDYIAMDIKAPLEKYEHAANSEVDKEKIQLSIDLIRDSGIDYEFRTTVVPDFFSEDDAHAIGKWLKHSKRYVLQQFRSNLGTLDPAFKERRVYPKDDLYFFQKIMKQYIHDVEIRGI